MTAPTSAIATHALADRFRDLCDGDATRRDDAARTLVNQTPTTLREAWIAFLDSADADIDVEAVREWVWAGADLADHVTDLEAAVARQLPDGALLHPGAFLLAYLGADAAPALKRLADQASAEGEPAFLWALGHLPAPDHDLLQDLLVLAGDDDRPAAARAAILRNLWVHAELLERNELGGRLVEILSASAASSDPGLRAAAARTVARIASTGLGSEDAASRLLASLREGLADDEDEVAAEVLDALVRHSALDADTLARLPELDSARLRVQVVEALAWTNLSDDVSAALEKATHDSHSKVRAAAVRTLADRPASIGEREVTRLLQLLDDRYKRVRRAVVEALEAAGAERISRVDVGPGALLSFLEETEGELQRRVARLLGELGQRAPAVASLATLTDDDDVYCAASALATLAQVFPGDDETRATIVPELLDDDEPEIAYEAALYLALHGENLDGREHEHTLGRSVLRAFLETEDDDLRSRAAAALAALPSSRERIAALTADDPDVLLEAIHVAAAHASEDDGDDLAKAFRGHLGHGDARIRRAALDALGELGALEPDDLNPLLDDVSLDVRWTATMNLVGMDEQPERTSAILAEALHAPALPRDHPEHARLEELRHESAQLLVDDPSLVTGIVPELLTAMETLSPVTAQIVRALMYADDSATDVMLERFASFRSALRPMLITMIVRKGSLEQRLAVLEAGLRDPVGIVRERALRELAGLLHAEETAPVDLSLEQLEQLEACVRPLRDAPVDRLRVGALGVLLLLHEARPDGEPLADVDALLEDASGDENEDMRVLVARHAEAGADPVALLTRLLGDESSVVVAAACDAVGALKEPSADLWQAMAGALDRPGIEVKLAAATVLARGGDAIEEEVAGRARATLVDLLDSSVPSERQHAAAALVEAGVRDAGLRERVVAHAKDEDIQVRALVVKALGQPVVDASEVELAAFMGALADASKEVRACAAQALLEHGHGNEEVAQALIKTLADEDDEVRCGALLAIGARGPALRRAASDVSKLLVARNSTVRTIAAFTLTRIAEPGDDVAEVFAETLEEARQPDVEFALFGLQSLGERAAAAAPQLAALLTSEDRRTSIGATNTLLGLGERAVLAAPQLVADLGKHDVDIGRAVASVLSRIAEDDAHVRGELVEAATGGTIARRQAALDTLVRLPDQVPIDVMSLAAGVEDEDAGVRMLTVRLLGRYAGESEALRASAPNLLADDDIGVRLAAAAAMAENGMADDRVVQVLQSALAEGDEERIVMAASGLAGLPEIPESLLEALQSAYQRAESIDARLHIVHALGRAGAAAAGAVPLVLDLLDGSDDPQVRQLGLWCITQIRPPADAVIETLRSALRDADPSTREQAAMSLADLKPKSVVSKAVPDLIELLDGEALRPRLAAAAALGELGPRARKAIDSLKAARAAGDHQLEHAATWALKRIQPDLV